MRKFVRLLMATAFALVAFGCGSSSPSSPTAASPGAGASATPSGVTFRAYGTVTEVPPGFNGVAGARVEITAGTNLGTNKSTDGQGDYSFPAMPRGTYTLQVTREGFLPLAKTVNVARDIRTDFLLYPIPPSGATARCKDKSWSFVTDRAQACTRGGGVSYWVCPGAFCEG